MDVILFETVPGLGPQGSIVSVAPGHFRNFLSPRGLAVEATETNRKRLQDKMRRLEEQAEKEAEEARTDAEKMADLTLTFKMKAGEEDKLFGSVTTMMIGEALEEQGFEVDRHQIVLPEAIRRLGMYTVDVKLHHDVDTTIKVLVEKEE